MSIQIEPLHLSSLSTSHTSPLSPPLHLPPPLASVCSTALLSHGEQNILCVPALALHQPVDCCPPAPQPSAAVEAAREATPSAAFEAAQGATPSAAVEAAREATLLSSSRGSTRGNSFSSTRGSARGNSPQQQSRQHKRQLSFSSTRGSGRGNSPQGTRAHRR